MIRAVRHVAGNACLMSLYSLSCSNLLQDADGHWSSTFEKVLPIVHNTSYVAHLPDIGPQIPRIRVTQPPSLQLSAISRTRYARDQHHLCLVNSWGGFVLWRAKYSIREAASLYIVFQLGIPRSFVVSRRAWTQSLSNDLGSAAQRSVYVY